MKGKDENEVDTLIHNIREYFLDEYKLKEKHAHCLKAIFSPKQLNWYYQVMQEQDSDKEPLSNSYSIPEV